MIKRLRTCKKTQKLKNLKHLVLIKKNVGRPTYTVQIFFLGFQSGHDKFDKNGPNDFLK